MTFAGKSGVLELAQSTTYFSTIGGFAEGDSLDLRDIGLTSKTKVTFLGNSLGGSLTVTDGTHTAFIRLAGDYRSDTFVAASDGGGGVLLTVHPTAPSAQAFVASMAGMAGPGPGVVHAAVGSPWGESRFSGLVFTSHGHSAT